MFELGDEFARVSGRMLDRSRACGHTRRGLRMRIALFLLLKAVLFPFRFIWLLLVWLRLRGTAVLRG